MIFTQEDMQRLQIIKTPNSDCLSTVIVNVHEMKCYEARRFINNLINVIHIAFTMVIIHGFNHGTAIKDMLAHSFINSHIQNQYLDIHNPGVTYMLLTA